MCVCEHKRHLYTVDQLALDCVMVALAGNYKDMCGMLCGAATTDGLHASAPRWLHLHGCKQKPYHGGVCHCI